MTQSHEILAGQPVANAVLVLSLVAASGLSLASLKVRGLGLGVAGVLFSGIAFAHFGYGIPHEILEFVREFGLILFVFTIGLQLGPGFFASLRQDGLRLNALALAVVLAGAVLTVAVARFGVAGFPAAFGLFSGASTNTPALGAVQQTLAIMGKSTPESSALPALAYAVSYPGGVVGIIVVLLLLRAIFRISPEHEAEQLRAAGSEPLERASLLVENPNLDGLPIAEIPALRETNVVISRILPARSTRVLRAADDTVLHAGDCLLVVGTATNLRRFEYVIGCRIEADLMNTTGALGFREIVVTQPGVIGQSVGEVGHRLHDSATITRIRRSDLEMTARADARLQFGDRLQLVGEPEGLERATVLLGNSQRALQVTNFIPIFVGIALGVLAGALPFQIPGVPLPVRLGLAGGPLLLAIFLSRLGRLGPLLLQMPPSANLALRELGITLFLACVGLKAGPLFVETVLSARGAVWFIAGLAVTVLPLLAVGLFARGVMKLNYLTVCGLLAGSMTDPPALAFACAVGKSDAPSTGYAAVYPLAMFARILVAQVLVLMFG
ncbi:MAG TPA: putative transporter [Chthoniobacteraceae bacterium]|jgi:putative transport protein|nr:putative transporter [Chthoniobacteraceae bacterium]